VLPPHFLAARQTALLRAQEYERKQQGIPEPLSDDQAQYSDPGYYGGSYTSREGEQSRSYASEPQSPPRYAGEPSYSDTGGTYQDEEDPSDEQFVDRRGDPTMMEQSVDSRSFQREVEEEGAFIDPTVPMDEAMDAAMANRPPPPRLDPPDDEPPSLSKRYVNYKEGAESVSTADQSGVIDYYASSPEKSHHSEGYFPQNYYYTTSQDEETNPSESQFVSKSEDTGEYTQDSKFFPDTSNFEPSLESSKMGRRSTELPPTSPRSNVSNNEMSQSSAMRGAQELIRRNRQRRLEAARTKELQEKLAPTDDDSRNPSSIPHTDSESGATWETGSDNMSSVVSGSSVWTDQSNNPDRSSRRALILQMAKARMKSNKPPEDGQHGYEEEKKLESHRDTDSTTNIDLTEDLD